MPAAFATILISHESSAVGSVTRRALTPEHVFNTPATHPCTAVPKTVRRRLTTADGPAPIVPVPTLVSLCSTSVYKRRNQRDTSNSALDTFKNAHGGRLFA